MRGLEAKRPLKRAMPERAGACWMGLGGDAGPSSDEDGHVWGSWTVCRVLGLAQTLWCDCSSPT